MLGYTPPCPVHTGIHNPPCAVQAGIRSTSGRYASHWNEFYFIMILKLREVTYRSRNQKLTNFITKIWESVMKDGKTPSFGKVTAMVEGAKTLIWLKSLPVMSFVQLQVMSTQNQLLIKNGKGKKEADAYLYKSLIIPDLCRFNRLLRYLSCKPYKHIKLLCGNSWKGIERLSCSFQRLLRFIQKGRRDNYDVTMLNTEWAKDKSTFFSHF